MKEMFFETERAFNQSGIGLMAIYTNKGDFLCDVSVEYFDVLAINGEVDDSQCFKRELTNEETEAFLRDHGVKVVIAEEALSFEKEQREIINELANLFSRAKDAGIGFYYYAENETLQAINAKCGVSWVGEEGLRTVHAYDYSVCVADVRHEFEDTDYVLL